jgi:hypothetical protein
MARDFSFLGTEQTATASFICEGGPPDISCHSFANASVGVQDIQL